MRNRILSVILVMCLILSIVPVTVNADPTDTTAPSFPSGYPKATMGEPGSRRIILGTGTLSEASEVYFVVVENGGSKPDDEQIKSGKDSSGAPAFHFYKTESIKPFITHSVISNFSFPAAEDNTEYYVYFLLEDAAGNKTNFGPLTAKTPAERTESICEYNGTGFVKIENAISSALANGGGTIKLLDHVYHNKAIKIDSNVDIIFDLNNKDLSIYTGHISDSTALEVSGGGSVTYTGNGYFNVTGGEYGVKIIGNNSSAVVSYVSSTKDSSIAASADDGSSITVNGNVRAGKDSTGVSSYGNVVVNGNIEVTCSSSTGAYSSYKGAITIYGNIIVSGARAVGIFASGEDACVDVYGKVSVSGGNSIGALAANGGKISVSNSGSAISMIGDSSCGISVGNVKEGKVTVNGNVEVTGDSAYGIDAEFGQVTVNGDVTVDESFVTGVKTSDFGFVKIDGNVTATGKKAKGIFAVMGEGAGGIVHVTESVNASSQDEDSVGIHCYSRETADGKSMVAVDGKVNADDTYIEIDDIIRIIDSKDNIENGYWTYIGRHGSIVKIGNSEGTGKGAVVSFTASSTPVNPPPSYGGRSSRSLPIVVTKSVSDIMQSRASMSGSVTSDSGASVTERGFVYGKNATPSIGGTGVVKITSGNGTGSFTSLAENLSADTLYHVRAYAVNSLGTGYGEDISFTTFLQVK